MTRAEGISGEGRGVTGRETRDGGGAGSEEEGNGCRQAALRGHTRATGLLKSSKADHYKKS